MNIEDAICVYIYCIGIVEQSFTASSLKSTKKITAFRLELFKMAARVEAYVKVRREGTVPLLRPRIPLPPASTPTGVALELLAAAPDWRAQPGNCRRVSGTRPWPEHLHKTECKVENCPEAALWAGISDDWTLSSCCGLSCSARAGDGATSLDQQLLPGSLTDRNAVGGVMHNLWWEIINNWCVE